MESKTSSITAFEVGRLYFERGDLLKAIEVLEAEASLLLQSKDHELLLEVIHLLLRSYAEQLEFGKIEAYKSLILQLINKESFIVTGKTYYILALCSSYNNDHTQALEYCQKSLTLSLAQENKDSACHAILGLAISYYSLDRLEEALKEIYNLQVFMSVLDLPQVRLAANILRGQIYRKNKKYDQALDVLWESYELLKSQKNLYMHLSLLAGIALTYKEAGQIDEARKYLLLAQKSVDVNNLKRLSQGLNQMAQAIGEGNTSRFDIVYKSSDHTVCEKTKGRIDFHNQFILLDLLKLFLTNPGVSFSKEQLVKLIWRQAYNPEVHDNKIYVTIKRLRQLVEPDIEKPKYIFRSKNGYYFNKEASVVIEEEKRERL